MNLLLCVCFSFFDYCYWKVSYLLTDTSFISFFVCVFRKLFRIKRECKSSLVSISVCFCRRGCPSITQVATYHPKWASVKTVSCLIKVEYKIFQIPFIYWRVMDLTYAGEPKHGSSNNISNGVPKTTSVPNIVIVIVRSTVFTHGGTSIWYINSPQWTKCLLTHTQTHRHTHKLFNSELRNKKCVYDELFGWYFVSCCVWKQFSATTKS